MSDEKKPCPNCGYCPTCGKANAQPWWGIQPYPYVPWLEPIPQIGWPPPTITWRYTTDTDTTAAVTTTVVGDHN